MFLAYRGLPVRRTSTIHPNLNPGYISEAKLILASTKNHAHRIYLAQGIYAEVTRHYRAKAWQVHPWTYPDYQSEGYHQFFTECRRLVRGCRP